MAISTDKSMFALVAFMAIIGIMFFVLSKTPQGAKATRQEQRRWKRYEKISICSDLYCCWLHRFCTIMAILLSREHRNLQTGMAQ
jgi:hypothetical protein